MRKFKLFFSIVLLALTIGCSSDDEQNPEELEFYYSVTLRNECPHDNATTVLTSHCITEVEYQHILDSKTVGVACEMFFIVDILGEGHDGYFASASKGSNEPDCIPGGKVL